MTHCVAVLYFSQRLEPRATMPLVSMLLDCICYTLWNAASTHSSLVARLGLSKAAARASPGLSVVVGSTCHATPQPRPAAHHGPACQCGNSLLAAACIRFFFLAQWPQGVTFRMSFATLKPWQSRCVCQRSPRRGATKISS